MRYRLPCGPMSYQGCVTRGHTGSTEAGRRKKATAKIADDVDELHCRRQPGS